MDNKYDKRRIKKLQPCIFYPNVIKAVIWKSNYIG